ncbi:MAG TPA: undecaprenyl-diphosphate phosphatase, partial [Treponemataceae bacterium]|nr:undecaprenyl-diphosphate phosphatase [Treponemataceae bacterium]
IGVLPGISRSGITIAASLISGLERKAAGEYSFLLSVFAITGAFILELKDADTLVSAVSPASLIAGMATAFLVGFLSLKFLLGLINRGKLGWFAFYLVPAGVSLAIYFATV